MKFFTYYEDGRKYSNINGEIILMEKSTKDMVKDICKSHFKKYKLQYDDIGDFIIIMVYVNKNAKTSIFHRDMELLDVPNMKWDIARFNKE